MEGVVKDLGVNLDGDERVPSPTQASSQPQSPSLKKGERPTSGAAKPSSEQNVVDHGLGRLVISNGRSRYVSNRDWVRMGEEIAEMRDILDEPSSEEEEDEVPSPQISTGSFGGSSLVDHGFIFSWPSMIGDLKSLRPQENEILLLRDIYTENVDPMTKILHRTTLRKVLPHATRDYSHVSRAEEVLLFSVYFAAVVSLHPSQCQSIFGQTKESLVSRFRLGVELGLSRASFLNSSNLMLLQAFTIFLISLRNQDDTRLQSAYLSLAIHLARALGVHRDGINFNLSPFETEMRRRLWWNLIILDLRSSEDHGTEASLLSDRGTDTQLPTNIDDDDISPDMLQWPEPREAGTEMTHCLVKFELMRAFPRLNQITEQSYPGSTREEIFELKEKVIDECFQTVEQKYLQFCDTSIP